MTHRRRHRNSRKKRTSKNIINKSITKSVGMVKTTSNKYMPKVKTGLENVGSKVITSSKKTIPFLQTLTRKLFSKIGSKTKRR